MVKSCTKSDYKDMSFKHEAKKYLMNIGYHDRSITTMAEENAKFRPHRVWVGLSIIKILLCNVFVAATKPTT